MLGSFLNNLLFSGLHYNLEQTTETTVVACHCIATAHINHHFLIDSNIFGKLVSLLKTKWKYNTHLSNSLN